MSFLILIIGANDTSVHDFSLFDKWLSEALATWLDIRLPTLYFLVICTKKLILTPWDDDFSVIGRLLAVLDTN